MENRIIAVFKDLYGNLWDLLQLNEDHTIMKRLKDSDRQF